MFSCSSKRQPTVSKSSAEAEYRRVANVVSESCWICNLLLELHIPVNKATLVYCNNVSAIYLSGNPVQHQRTNYIEMVLNIGLGCTHHKERDSTSQHKGGSALKPYGNKGTNPFAL